jgi:pimeloyl-ACP methyl ester carboxylesterase
MKNKIKNSIILTTLAILLMYIINKIIFAVSILKNLLTTDEGYYFDWRFGKVYYTKQGTGSPLLLIHELSPYSSEVEWCELIHSLSKNHTVYTLDLLGCGRSDKPNITYTNYLFVQLITDFIKNIIHKKTDVVCTGSSSSIILMACYNNDTLFNKIMLINPEDISLINKIPNKRTKMLKLLIELPIIGTLVYNITTTRKNVEDLFVEQYLFNPFRIQSKYINTYYESSHLGGPNARYLLSSLKGRYMNVNIGRALEEINNSIFIIGGEEELHIQEIIKNYVNLNHSIEYNYLSRAKHLPQIETPHSLLEQMKIFFSQA